MKRSSRSKNFIVLKQKNDVDKIINFFMNSYWSKTGIFVKLMRKDSIKWKNWSDFNERIEEISGFYIRQLQEEDWSKIKTQSWNSLARYRNCKTKLYGWFKRFSRCWNQYAVGHSHVTSQLVFFSPHPILGGMLSRSIEMPSPKDGLPSIWDTHGMSGNFFFKSSRVFFLHFIRRNWIHGVLICRNPLINGGEEMRNKHQFKIRDASPHRQPEIQSSLVREIFQIILVQTNKNCRIQIVILTYSPHRQRSLFWKIKIQDWGMLLVHNFLRKACSGSKKWRWLIQWLTYNLRHL